MQSAAWPGSRIPAGRHGFLAGTLAKTTGAHPSVFGWYGDFLQNVASPNGRIFSYTRPEPAAATQFSRFILGVN